MRLNVYSWNKTSKYEQDKAILNMLRILNDLAEYRKTGIGDEFNSIY